MGNPKTFQNAKNIPLNAKAGMVPNMRGAIENYFQPMVFGLVTKALIAGFENEVMQLVNFRGSALTPYKPRSLVMKDIGQRKWKYWQFYGEPQLRLEIDDVLFYLGKQYRVFESQDYRLYNFMWYSLVQDYTGAGPQPLDTVIDSQGNVVVDNEGDVVVDNEGAPQ